MASTMHHPPESGFLRFVGGSILLHIVVIAVGLILLNRTPKRNFLTPVYSVSLVAPKERPVVKRAAKPVTVKKKRVAAKPVEKKALKSVKVKTVKAKTVKVKTDAAAKRKKIKERELKTVTSAVERLKKKVERRREQELVASKITELGAREKEEESKIQNRLKAIRSGLIFLDEKKKEVETDGALVPGNASPEDAGIATGLYLGLLKDRVQNEWSYPEVLRNTELSVIVAIKIDRDGRLVNLRVEKSSGNPRFDDSLLRAVKKAAPFAPLPEGIKGAYLDTGLRFCPACK